MRPRWTALFYISLITLIGVAWLVERNDVSLKALVNLELAGMVAATGVAFVAMITNARRRWPAAVALVCAAPMLSKITFPALPHIIEIIESNGIPAIVILGGSVATLVVAGYILVAPVPPIPDDPIARARAR